MMNSIFKNYVCRVKAMGPVYSFAKVLLLALFMVSCNQEIAPFLRQVRSFAHTHLHYASHGTAMDIDASVTIFKPPEKPVSRFVEIRGGIPICIELDREYRGMINYWHTPVNYTEYQVDDSTGSLFADTILNYNGYVFAVMSDMLRVRIRHWRFFDRKQVGHYDRSCRRILESISIAQFEWRPHIIIYLYEKPISLICWRQPDYNCLIAIRTAFSFAKHYYSTLFLSAYFYCYTILLVRRLCGTRICLYMTCFWIFLWYVGAFSIVKRIIQDIIVDIIRLIMFTWNIQNFVYDNSMSGIFQLVYDTVARYM